MDSSPTTAPQPRHREYIVLLVIAAAVLLWSGIAPKDRVTWWLEVTPVLIGAPLLIATYRRFPLTPLLYRLIFLHAVVVMVGGHYTYAEVPIGDWLRNWLHLARNNYDRLGHLMQGFVPAMITREILVRRSPLAGSRWLPFLATCVVVSISVMYEFIEWWAALIMGGSAESFLALQGDVWDTQWDMFLALCGAVLALLVLSRLHDRQLDRLGHSARR
jgi:putative membrane protein